MAAYSRGKIAVSEIFNIVHTVELLRYISNNSTCVSNTIDMLKLFGCAYLSFFK